MGKQIDDASLKASPLTKAEIEAGGANAWVPSSYTTSGTPTGVDKVVDLGSAALRDEAFFATATQGGTADTVAAAISGKTLLKHNTAATADPTVSNNASQGYAVGSEWTRTNVSPPTKWQLVAFDGTDAEWEPVPFTSNLAAVAISGSFQDIPDLVIGTSAQYNDDRYVKPNTQDNVVIDCGGDINKSRTVPGGAIQSSQRAHWRGNPGGARPTNAVAGDVWDGPVFGVRLTSRQEGTSLTLGPTLVGHDIIGRNATKLTITLPSDATASYDVDAPFEIIRDNAVIEFRAGSGATINGVSNARYEINTLYARAKIRKTAANTWRVEPGTHLTELAAGAEFFYPASADNSHTIDGDDYVVSILGSATTGTVTGSITVSGADLNVWRLYQAAGGSAGRNRASGASGGQTDEDETDTLVAGEYAYSLGAPGAGVTTGNTDGSDGGDLIFDGVTYAGGKRGLFNNSTSPKAGIAGFNGSGAAYQQGSSLTAGTGGATTGGGFKGGDSAGSATSTQASGGGGGSGQAGGDGNATTGKGGKGGDGKFSLIEGGSGKYYGAGGRGQGAVSDGDHAQGVDDYGAGSGVKTAPETGSADNTRAGRRAALIFRFAIADCASEPQAV